MHLVIPMCGQENALKQRYICFISVSDDFQVLAEFLDTFDVSNHDGKVTLAEFIEYYSNVSASIDDDT